MAHPDSSMDFLAGLRKQLVEAHPDILGTVLAETIDRVMGLEADILCGAEHGERTPDRVNSRNGYRLREWDTRAGTPELSIPKLRKGTYFPDWLLEGRRRAERAMISVIAEAYVLGISTRRVEGLVQQLGITGISKSQVSVLAKELDQTVDAFRNRPLDCGPYTYVWVDALTQRCRENGRVVNVATVIATGVIAEGRPEVLGVDVFTAEDGAAWTAFLRGLVARGLSGVRLVISDSHEGLKAAIAAVLPGASWQRCRVHFIRNVMARVPKSAQDLVATLVRSIFAQPDAQAALEQHERVCRQLEQRLTKTFRSTNPIESMLSVSRTVMRNVKRWRSGSMALRWTAAGAWTRRRSSARSTAATICTCSSTRSRRHSSRQSASK